MVNSYRMSGSNNESVADMTPAAVVVRHTFFDLVDDVLESKLTNECQGRRRFFSDTDLIDFKLRDEDFESIATTASNASDFSSDSEETFDDSCEGNIFIPLQDDDHEQVVPQEQQQVQMMWLPVTFAVPAMSGVNEACAIRQSTGKRCKRSAFVAKKREERALRRAQREAEGTALAAASSPCASAQPVNLEVASSEATDSTLHLLVPGNMDSEGVRSMLNSQGFEDLYTSITIVSCNESGNQVRVVLVSRKVAEYAVQLLPEELRPALA